MSNYSHGWLKLQCAEKIVIYFEAVHKPRYLQFFPNSILKGPHRKKVYGQFFRILSWHLFLLLTFWFGKHIESTSTLVLLLIVSLHFYEYNNHMTDGTQRQNNSFCQTQTRALDFRLLKS